MAPLPTDPPGERPAARRARVLFVCTGNYYRSRFAEALWNHLEAARPIGWQAVSGGLKLSRGAYNVGPISRYAVDGLRERGVELAPPVREPRQAAAEDFAAAGHIVAASAAEHRDMVQERFPLWAEAVEYWDVEDIDLCDPLRAMDLLDAHVRALRERLARGGG